MQTVFTVLHGALQKKATVSDTPDNHQPANIIGLCMLAHLGLQVSPSEFRLQGAFDGVF
jgi:hypothetical protein